MARSFTVLELITRAKYAADMENASFISLTEWKTLLSTAYAELYAILVESGMRYFETEDEITTDGNHSYALPAGFLTSVGVDFEVNASSGERWPLQPLMVQERNQFTGVGSSESRCYSLAGSNLRLYPTPKTGQTYYHVYVPQPVEHSASADETPIDVVTPDGEAFITWHMAFRAMSKAEGDTRDARAEREAARDRVANWAALRSLHEPRRRIVQQELGYDAQDPGDWRY